MHRCIALGPETTLQDVCHLLQSFEVFGGESSLFERLRLPGGVCGFSCWDWSIGRLHRGLKTRGEYTIYRKHPPKKAGGPGHTHLGPPAAVIHSLRSNLRDLEHGRRHRAVQRPANMHRLRALVRNVFHGAQAHVWTGA